MQTLRFSLSWLMAALLIFLLGWLVLPTPAQVVRDEVILLPGRIIAPSQVENPITLKSYDIDVSIRDNVATTTVEQRLVNHSGHTVEAKFLYPLPEDANYSGFTLTINGKPVEGKLMEKDEARRQYYEIVRKLIDPGLLEFVDNRTVQASIAPIFAGEEKTVRLSYTQLLAKDGGMTRYQYPFAMKQGRHIPVEKASVDVSLKTAQPLKTIYSPSHSPKVVRKGAQEAEVSLTLDKSTVLQEKNFVLYFNQAPGSGDLSANSLTYRKSADEDGFFLFALQAPHDLGDRVKLPKNIVLVLDTSGSMSGDKIAQAKQALRYIIERLRPEDRFNIVQFNTDVSSYKEELISASPAHKKDALAYVDALRADGSTNIEEALRTAFRQAKNTDTNPDYVIFLTDGEPTVGMTDTPGLLKVAQESNANRANLFNFGVGYNLNTQLLEKLSTENHGSSTYVEPNEDLELALTGFYNKMESPVLTEVSLDFGALNVGKLYPSEVGDLFAGSEVILLGRYKGGGAQTIVMSGKVGSETKSYRFPVTWETSRHTTHSHLPRLWAGRRIAYLLDQIKQNGENAELKSEVIDLSKQYGILTPYTSFLALDPNESGSNQPRPVPMASAAEAKLRRDFASSGGMGGVTAQKALNRMKVQSSAADMAAAQESVYGAAYVPAIVHLDGKTFILDRQGVWVDTVYEREIHGKPIQVPFGTNEYFDLLNNQPTLARYFSLGQQVLAVIGNQAYQVVLGQATSAPSTLD